MSIFVKYPTREQLFESLAQTIAQELQQAIISKNTASLAVPGGTTPAPLFQLLRNAEIGWQDVNVMLTDERFVPETSSRSNARLLRQNLFKGAASKANFVPMYSAANAPEDVMMDLREGIAKALPLDVCVLGMGADMHTASIFPEADLLDEALAPDAPILLPMRAPNAPEPRLTLTAPVLRAAKSVHLLIVGTEKRRALKAAKEATSSHDAPVRIILDQAQIHYAD